MKLRHAILAACIMVLGVGRAVASTEFVYYEDQAGEIHELALSNGTKWTDTPLTLASRTPTAQLTSNTLSYVTEGNGAKHIFFIGHDGNIDELTNKNGWQSVLPLTSTSGAGAPAPQGSLFITMGNAWGQNVFYFSASGDVIHLFTCPLTPPKPPQANGKNCTTGTWEFTDLTTAPNGGNPTAPKGGNSQMVVPSIGPGIVVGLTAKTTMSSISDTDGDHVYYFSTNGDLQHLLFTGSPRTAMQVIDLSKTTTGNILSTLAGPGIPTLTSFYDSWGEHIFTGDPLLGQVYCSGTCSQQGFSNVPNFTTYSSYKNGFTVTPLTGFSDAQGEHVFYLDNQHGPSEAYYNGSKWAIINYEVSAPGNSPASLAGNQSPLLSLTDSTGGHVFYWDGSGLLNELTTVWASNLVTQTHTVVHTTANKTISPLVPAVNTQNNVPLPISNTITGFIQ